MFHKFNDNGSERVEAKYCAAVRETVFYNNIAPETPDCPSVRCYDAQADMSTGRVHLLLEDVTESHYLVPASSNKSPYGGWKCFNSVPMNQWEAVTDAIVDFQCHWWDRDRIHKEDVVQSSGDLPSMADTASDEVAQQIADLKSHEATLGEGATALAENAIASRSRLYRERTAGMNGLTFIHNGYHLRNVLFPRSGDEDRVIIFDWENITRGIGISDIAHLITSSMLPPKMRFEIDNHLVRRYRDRVIASGIAYSSDDCWEDFCLSLIGLITLHYDKKLIALNILRAMRDWGCDSLFD